jgi:hypothetical protein
VSLIPVRHVEMRIYSKIVENFLNGAYGIIRGSGEDDP